MNLWEGRFTSQALLDEWALLACMAYVDLNPIRSKLAKTPEASSHTSIQKRIQSLPLTPPKPSNLLPFTGNVRDDTPIGIPFNFSDYLELVDWTGRAIRDDKRGFIPNGLPSILSRLEIPPERWLWLTTQFEQMHGFVGSPKQIRAIAEMLGYQRTPGITQNQRLFN